MRWWLRWPAVIVWVGWVLAAAILPLLLAIASVDQVPLIAVEAVIAAYVLVLATIVARRAPGHPIAALLAATSVVVAVTVTPVDLGPFAGTWMLLYLPLAFLLLLVPDGRFASRAWRVVGLSLLAVVVVFNAGVALDWVIDERAAGSAGSTGGADAAATSPFEIVALAVLPVFFGLLVASLVSVVARYRRADARQRLQLRWMFVVGASLPLTLLLCWTSYLLIGTADLVGFGLAIMYLAIPTGVAVAIVRPDWFDVDRAAVATLTATALSVVVLAVLSVVCAVTGLTLLAWSPVVAIVTTIALTLLVVPLYGFARRRFGRWLYPERERAVDAMRRLRARVDAGEAEPETVQAELRAALRDPELVVAYRALAEGGAGSLVTVDGAPLTSPAPLTSLASPFDLARDAAPVTDIRLTTPVRLRGEEIGVLVASPARLTRPAHAIADAAAPLVDAVRFRAELRRTMDEVAASRERLVRASFEERRRLERDLHDGAQQRLVALGMRLRVLQRAGGADTELVESLDVAVAELGTAVAELRQIAHGVRPSALDDGLGPALADLARLSPSVIEIDAHGAEVPDAVGTTAYFVASEAVANALKHAAASSIRVRVRTVDETLHLAITDDGCGGAVVRPSAGLAGLEDRVAALGGRLEVRSPHGGGTTVEAVLPCGS
ncbi:histidine kinase [Agromyces sp. NPDC058110]|uniref:sensor histidine kinase n=1 Tax=Agromyces sp. NPDC058110 TaxID=3346345 RepID=UPI0036DA2D98